MKTSQPNYGFFSQRTLPVILQDEGAECGLACIAMIASYWGHCIDIAGMRERFSLSLKGTDLRGMCDIARGIGLNARPLKVGLTRLGDLSLPAVLHWDMTHFVVIKSIRGSKVVIHDPSVGERRLSMDEVSRHYSGIALEMTPGSSFAAQDQTRKISLRAIMGPIVGLKRGLLQLLSLGIALQICVLLAPFLLQWVVDGALKTADRSLVSVLGIGFLVLVGIQAAIGALRSWVATVLSTSLKFGWLGNAFGHLLHLPLTYFERRHVGDILSRFVSIQAIQRSLTTQFVEGVLDGILVVSTVVVMFSYSTALTAISLCAVLAYAAVRTVLSGHLRAATAEQIVHSAKQETYFLESVRGVQSVRLFNREGERRIGWLNILSDQFNAELIISKLTITHQTLNFLLFNAERVIVIWIGAMAVIDRTLTVGMLFAYLSYREHFSTRLAALIDKAIELRMLRVHMERVADVMMTQAQYGQNEVQIDPTSVSPSIELRNVSFRYSKGDPLVLDRVNLFVPPNEFIAITGASGCGKTTLVKVMLGLLDPTEGEVFIGGVPIKNLGHTNLRNMVGTVMQGDALFTGTIADNICFFDPTVDSKRVEACALAAAIHGEILDMPMRYNSLVGDVGSGLSGGQQQRLLLARALYKQPSILVLDEATSNLDVSNEYAVNESIRKRNLTRVVVAHRPETIAMASRVVCLENGSICSDVKTPQAKSAFAEAS